jgi:DNA-binding NarL/FixJ family response regulator
VTRPVRVLVADDQALLRGSFRLLVESDPGFRVVGETSDGDEAVQVARQRLPDVVLMDVRMPGTDGIEATRQICADPVTETVRVLVLTMFDLDAYVYAALRAGASGFLLKDTPPAEVLRGIRTVAAGDALLAPSVTRRLVAEFARRPHHIGPLTTNLDGVTDREREVFTLIARGLSNQEIRDHLHISAGTLKSHIGSLLAKLHARDRAQLVIAAYESGLVTPAHPRLEAP